MAGPTDIGALHPALPALERLETLRQMREGGMISAVEYDAQRTAILDEAISVEDQASRLARASPTSGV
jgi:hypothetical protein